MCSFILALLPTFQNHVFYNSRLAGTLMYITQPLQKTSNFLKNATFIEETNSRGNYLYHPLTFGFSISSSTSKAVISLSNIDEAGKSLLIIKYKNTIQGGNDNVSWPYLRIHCSVSQIQSKRKTRERGGWGGRGLQKKTQSFQCYQTDLFGFSTFKGFLEVSMFSSLFGTWPASHSLVDETFIDDSDKFSGSQKGHETIIRKLSKEESKKERKRAALLTLKRT